MFAFLVSIFVPVAAFADEIGDVVAPTGIMALVVIIPLIVVLVLLFMKVDMIIAGLIGGVLAMLIGGIGLEEANKQMLEAIPMMLGITVPIINSAVAMAVFKAGSYSAALTLAKRGTKGKVEYVSAFIVILLAAATYMSGIGGGSAMVIAPLAFAAVGVVPELIAAMSLAAAVSFTTSPASLESSIVSKLGDISVGSY
ncbi:citrate transporter, partial [Enterococcus faecalis]